MTTTQTITVKIRLPKEQAAKVREFDEDMEAFLESVPRHPEFATMTSKEIKEDLENRE